MFHVRNTGISAKITAKTDLLGTSSSSSAAHLDRCRLWSLAGSQPCWLHFPCAVASTLLYVWWEASWPKVWKAGFAHAF